MDNEDRITEMLKKYLEDVPVLEHPVIQDFKNKLNSTISNCKERCKNSECKMYGKDGSCQTIRRQTRSIDEGESVFIVCTLCGKQVSFSRG